MDVATLTNLSVCHSTPWMNSHIRYCVVGIPPWDRIFDWVTTERYTNTSHRLFHRDTIQHWLDCFWYHPRNLFHYFLCSNVCVTNHSRRQLVNPLVIVARLSACPLVRYQDLQQEDSRYLTHTSSRGGCTGQFYTPVNVSTLGWRDVDFIEKHGQIFKLV